MDVERYLEAHPVPARPSDKSLRAYLQGYIQAAEVGGKRFTAGAAQALATLAAATIMRAPGIAARRRAAAAALANLDAVAARVDAAADASLTTAGRHARDSGRLDAHTIKLLIRQDAFHDIAGYGARAATPSSRPAAPRLAAAAGAGAPVERAEDGDGDAGSAGDDDAPSDATAAAPVAAADAAEAGAAEPEPRASTA